MERWTGYECRRTTAKSEQCENPVLCKPGVSWAIDPPSNGDSSGRAEARVRLHTAAAAGLGSGGGDDAGVGGGGAGDGVRGAGAVHPGLVRDQLPQGVLLLYLEDVGLLSQVLADPAGTDGDGGQTRVVMQQGVR